jgi:hypothetical protein
VRAELYEKEKGSNGDLATFVANSVPLPMEPSNVHNPLSDSNRGLPRLDPSTARSNVPSPPSLVNSPQNYMVENNPTADPIRTPSSISTSEFEPVRPSCVSPQFLETQRQADAPQPNTASESIVKLLKQRTKQKHPTSIMMLQFIEKLQRPTSSYFLPKHTGLSASTPGSLPDRTLFVLD